MIEYKTDFTYLISQDCRLFTVSLIPHAEGKFPTVIIRTPYVDMYENETEINITISYLNEYKKRFTIAQNTSNRLMKYKEIKLDY